jgi:hypothetical protein
MDACRSVQSPLNTEHAAAMMAFMSTRTLNNDDLATAVAELKAVLEEIDVEAEFLPRSDGADLLLPGAVLVEVKSAARPSLAQLRRWGLGEPQAADMDRVVVLVADWIDPELRRELRQASWGWLERAGHLRLVTEGYHIDREIEPLLAPEVQTQNPLRRDSGLAVAIELLAHKASGPPPTPVTVRHVAAAAGVSVGSAHKAMAELTELALLDKDGVPRSSLFWSVAQEWTLQWFPLSRPPAPDVSETLQRLLRFRLDDLDDVGWAEVGDGAAAALGAPIVAEGPPRLLLPDRRALTWTLRTFGEAADEGSAAAFVAAPRTAAAVRHRTPGTPWPLAREIVIAIELAGSGPRGREALAQWTDRPSGVPDDW